MKKTLLALAGLNLFVSFGQVVTNDFENITLTVESFDNGSSGSGGFTEDHAFYENTCLLYTSPSPRDVEESRMPSSA